MTTVYKCDTCGKTFDDEDECLAHERRHLMDSSLPYIHLWDVDGNRLVFDYEDGDPDDVHAIKCDTDEACAAVVWWFEFHGYVPPEDTDGYRLVCPNDLVFWDDSGYGHWRSLKEMKNMIQFYEENFI